LQAILLEDQSGGGIALAGFVHANVTSCIFLGNTSNVVGGAIGVREDAFADITHCQFIENNADRSGGGIYLYENSRA
jgi:predicted outer membrane repeat protein